MKPAVIDLRKLGGLLGMIDYSIQDMEALLGARLDGKVRPEIKRLCWEVIKHKAMAAYIKRLKAAFPECTIESIT